ncbi:MAG: hypothetical protein KKE17_15155 [Proteobacteria bacterium]|nr:hypothetical protein [Pseudomonadota bacterium]MBU1711337.1 hypothetical protein [Pseudomonadota bacterium]
MKFITILLKAVSLVLLFASCLSLLLSLATPEKGAMYIVYSMCVTTLILVATVSTTIYSTFRPVNSYIMEFTHFNRLFLKYPLAIFYLLITFITIAAELIYHNDNFLTNLKILLPFTIFLGISNILLKVCLPEEGIDYD